MLILFGILVIIASIILGMIVLVQNPKGGGLSGSLGGFSNQLMGVKQTTDVLEKGTWIFAGIVGILCVISPLFIPKTAGGSSRNDDLINKAPASAPLPQQNTIPLPGSVTPTTATPATTTPTTTTPTTTTPETTTPTTANPGSVPPKTTKP